MGAQAKLRGFANHTYGSGRQPGFFLFDDETCVRISWAFKENMINSYTIIEPVQKDGGVLIPAGAVFNDGETIGIVYEDVWIPSVNSDNEEIGSVPGSLVTRGTIDLSKAPALREAVDTLGAQGFKFMYSGVVERPY